MRIKSVAVLGAGAVGSYIIWGLSNRKDIKLGVIAEGERKERLEKNGCLINEKVYHPEVWTPSEANGVDLLIVSLKYGALPGAVDSIKEAVGDKKGIRRYGSCILPMDECLVLCAIDLGGRPYLSFEGAFTSEKIGDMSTEMVKEFFYAISYTAAMNLHIKVLTPGNNHHMAEAMFKSFAKALDMAVAYDPRITDVLSTKGSL